MNRHAFFVGAFLAVGVLLIVWGVVVYQFGSLSNSFRYLQGYNYVVYPAKIDVGEGARSDKRTATTTIRNLSFSPIRVIGAMTTCNCLTTTGLPLTIAPRQAEDLQFSIFLEASTGKVEQMANILIDDGQMQRTAVVITGKCSSPQTVQK